MFQLRIVVALIALGTLLAASALPIHGGSTDMLLNRRALPSPPPPQTRALDMAQCDTSLTDDSNPAWAALARALVERQRAGPLPPGQRGGVQGQANRTVNQNQVVGNRQRPPPPPRARMLGQLMAAKQRRRVGPKRQDSQSAGEEKAQLFLEYISSHYSAAIRLYVDLYLLIGGRLNPMAAAEALMELVPSGNSRRNGPQSNNSALENDEEKERAMAATYAAYTKRTKLHAEKAKAQQLSRQLKTRLQFARLKVDYGWTRQSLNEVENLYFHLSRARPIPQQPTAKSDVSDKEQTQSDDANTPPTIAATHIQPSLESPIDTATQSTHREASFTDSSHSKSLPGPSTSPVPSPFRTPSQPSFSQTSSAAPKRPPFVERTRTGGIVRQSQPIERLRTGGKVKSTNTALSPKKRGRPRIPDDAEAVASASGVAITSIDAGGTEGTLTYDSFWSSLNSLKTPAGS
ncbi:hypothetical protein CTheo_4996 [Ceratobasidium theobromae]|uniref:Transmembrane protein n=1 Tax=Ceratobasidium theobromae TaxID=1582974 RepID=A0A5N5QJV4_9AGAM|nr:hypothetical protein CTheo_4996 [Ceratobasidium theobromae]